jgi:hypothetical protein
VSEGDVSDDGDSDGIGGISDSVGIDAGGASGIGCAAGSGTILFFGLDFFFLATRLAFFFAPFFFVFRFTN